MYRLREIIEKFSSLVGWKDTDTLSQSESGLYFQEAHPLLTLRAMRGIMPKDLLSRYPLYEMGTEYAKGVKVQSNGKCYRSLVDNNTAELTDTASWREYDLLEDYLAALTETGIKKVLARFIGEKVKGMETRNLVDRRTLFDGAGRKEGRNPNTGRLVGFEFNPIRANGITTTLNKVGMQFTGNVGTVKLYLFHSSQSEPIATKEVEYTSEKGSFMWFDLEEWVMPYVNDTINAGGSWYVVYDEASLADYMQSINFGKDWSREPCGTCNKGDIQLYRLMLKYLTISPFYVAMSDWNGELWDIEDNVYTYGNNYGLNFMVTMACDVTDAILAESFNFATAIQLQVATEALRALALNPEVAVNRVQANADRDNILFELSGNGQGIKGLNGELERAYKVLEIDTKGLDPICMGCHNKGVHYGSI
jgi:hypothetical protein